MRILYYDCFAGASGDMNLGALLDLGVPVEHLKAQLDRLGLPGWRMTVERTTRRSVSGTRVVVELDPPDREARGHDEHGHEDQHGHDGPHTHDHHSRGHEDHRPHRGLSRIRELILASSLSASVKERSVAIFARLAEAEARVHDIPVESVHFHEVGGVDAIVDIVGAAVCLESLAPDQVWCGPVELGSGTVKCAHGVFPVPAPATAAILSARSVPVTVGRLPFEATTPTGAAILATVVDHFVERPALILEKVGYGLGTRDPETPNALRAYLARESSGTATEALPEDVSREPALMVECTIDDMTAEALGAVAGELMAAGARDVWLSPVTMKKSRPGTILAALCTPQSVAAVRDAIFRHTTTIGLRQSELDKFVLRREETSVVVDGETVRVKRSYYAGRLRHAKPEHDDCLRLAAKLRISLSEAVERVSRKLDPGA